MLKSHMSKTHGLHKSKHVGGLWESTLLSIRIPRYLAKHYSENIFQGCIVMSLTFEVIDPGRICLVQSDEILC